MIADGVDVMFPLLNVISLPGYLAEMVTQGVKPGQIQFYQSGYNAQSGDLVSSKVVEFGGRRSRRALQRHGDRRARRDRRVPPARTSSRPSSARCATASTRRRAATKYSADRSRRRTRAYGATVGMCTFIRTIARAIEAAGPNPTRKDLAAAVESLGAIDGGDELRRSFGPGKYTAPTRCTR